MLSNFLLLLSSLHLSCAYAASHENFLDFNEREAPVRVINLASQEKTADQIIEENRDNPAFMSCAEWLAQERPDFIVDSFVDHPLFTLLREAMSLADFEADNFSLAIHHFMQPDVPTVQGQNLKREFENSMNAKNCVNHLITVIQEEKTIQEYLEEYFEDRFVSVVHYQSDLLLRNPTLIDMSGVTTARMSEGSPDKDAFLRSYNTKNTIMRGLLDHLKRQNPRPLHEQLSPKLISLLRLSVSLHPFFNKENDEWVDYDQALKSAEGRNFLGNTAALGIDFKAFLSFHNLQGVKFPKVYKDLYSFPLPSFLLDEEVKKKKKKKKEKKEKKEKQNKAVTQQPNIEDIVTTSISSEKALIPSDSPESEHDHPIAVLPPSAGAEIDPVQPVAPLPPVASAKAKRPTPAALPQATRVRNAHVDTIHEIFSPQGYKHLDDAKIIAAWNHVLEGRGFLKESTGRSHQPLYASLTDGSHVVLGLFRSKGYGPRYMKYVREAFDNIGFGREWLESQGYRLD